MQSVLNARTKTRQKAEALKLLSFGIHRDRSQRDGYDVVARHMIALSLRMDRLRARLGRGAQ